VALAAWVVLLPYFRFLILVVAAAVAAQLVALAGTAAADEELIVAAAADHVSPRPILVVAVEEDGFFLAVVLVHTLHLLGASFSSVIPIHFQPLQRPGLQLSHALAAIVFTNSPALAL
jgi:hypothetical protein